jgi:hypothetical protein
VSARLSREISQSIWHTCRQLLSTSAIPVSCRALSSRNAQCQDVADILHETFSGFSQTMLVIHKIRRWMLESVSSARRFFAEPGEQNFLFARHFPESGQEIFRHDWLIPFTMAKKFFT